jgi:hypothetical protein
MNDTQRLDWLEREARRLISAAKLEWPYGYKFQVAIKVTGQLKDPWEYSAWFDSLRDAIDEGMKHTL